MFWVAYRCATLVDSRSRCSVSRFRSATGVQIHDQQERKDQDGDDDDVFLVELNTLHFLFLHQAVAPDEGIYILARNVPNGLQSAGSGWILWQKPCNMKRYDRLLPDNKKPQNCF